ncbi:MAG: hypothetical protein WBO00_04125, partial [Steroidobacteraceae bacterium]
AWQRAGGWGADITMVSPRAAHYHSARWRPAEDWLKSGALDHVPADIADQHAPLLSKHLERVKNHPKIAANYAARRK